MTIIRKNTLDAEAFGGTEIGVEIAVDGHSMRVSADTALGFAALVELQARRAIDMREEQGKAMALAFGSSD